MDTQMKSRKELKQEAKDALAGRWGSAILMTLVPNLIIIAIVIVLTTPMMASSIMATDLLDSAAASDTLDTALILAVSSRAAVMFLISLVAGLFQIVLESGADYTFLDTVRGRKNEPYRIADAFRCFRSPYIWGLIITMLLVSIFSYLWSLLFIIPGVIKAYSYSQSYFVFYDIAEGTGEKPGALECITASRRLMKGYKWNLFVLQLSFIGWGILASITVIGMLWFIPYVKATQAAFYNALPNEVDTY